MSTRVQAWKIQPQDSCKFAENLDVKCPVCYPDVRAEAHILYGEPGAPMIDIIVFNEHGPDIEIVLEDEQTLDLIKEYLVKSRRTSG